MEISTSLIGLGIETITTLCAVGVVVYKLGRAVERFEAIGRQQATEISQLKDSVKIISDVVTKIALTNQRQDVLEERQNRMEQLVDDLRRGEGFIRHQGSHES